LALAVPIIFRVLRQVKQAQQDMQENATEKIVDKM